MTTNECRNALFDAVDFGLDWGLRGVGQDLSFGPWRERQ